MENIVGWVNGWTLGGKLSLILFAVFVGGIILTALKMVKYSEVIIGKSKFGGAFVGGALIAIFSSMPELITEVLQALADKPGAGVADDLGANAVSGLAIGLALFVLIKQSFTKNMGKFTKISILVNAGLGFLLAFFMFMQKDVALGTAGTFVIGLVPILMLLMYVGSLWVAYKFNKDEEEVDMEKIKNISLKKGSLLFVFFGFLVFGFAFLLNIAVDSMSEGYGIGQASAGGIFLSMTTSLPEVVAFIALLRAKQFTAAILAIVGSQMFNMGISIFGDMAYTSKPIFTADAVKDDWGLAVMFGLEMLFVGLHVLLEKKMTKLWTRSVFPTLIVSTYIIGWTLILVL